MAVSHVLHGTAKGRISVGLEKTELIRKVARMLNYVPNLAAKQLVQGRSDMIGVLAAHTGSMAAPVRDLTASVSGLMDSSQASTIFSYTGFDRERIETVVREFSGRGVKGMLVLASDFNVNWEGYGTLLETGIPTVCVGRPPMDVPKPCVGFDFAKGSEALVDHLVATGRKRIAIMLHDVYWYSNVERKRGYLRGLDKAGIPRDDDLILVETDDSYHDLVNYPDRLAEVVHETFLSNAADAVIANNDLGALSLIRTFSKAGVRVPDDVAVAGQNNEPFTSVSSPSITSVDYKPSVLAKAAMETFNELLNDPSVPVKHLMITPDVIVRESTGNV